MFLLIFVAFLSVITFPFRRQWRDAIDALMDEINRRGGPPTPMHPLPSNDGRLLRRRLRNPRNPL